MTTIKGKYKYMPSCFCYNDITIIIEAFGSKISGFQNEGGRHMANK